jgi:hypothetical protein
MVGLPYLLEIKAEALHLADRTFEALEAVREAEALVARCGERRWCVEPHRLKGVFLAAMDAEENQIEASFCEAIRVAKKQKSVSLEKRAEATYAEYRRQKASGAGARGFRVTSLLTAYSVPAFLPGIQPPARLTIRKQWATPGRILSQAQFGNGHRSVGSEGVGWESRMSGTSERHINYVSVAR